MGYIYQADVYCDDCGEEIRSSCDKVQGVEVVRQLVRKEWERTKQAIHKLRRERSRVEQYGIEY